MPTKRRTIKRPPRAVITPRAIELFNQLRAVECTCEPVDWKGEYWKHQPCPGCQEWWRLHSLLHRELDCQVYQWPCVQNPDAPDYYPPDHANHGKMVNPEARRLWRQLEQAAAAAEGAKVEAESSGA
jgi:hypothetical protein